MISPFQDKRPEVDFDLPENSAGNCAMCGRPVKPTRTLVWHHDTTRQDRHAHPPGVPEIEELQLRLWGKSYDEGLHIMTNVHGFTEPPHGPHGPKQPLDGTLYYRDTVEARWDGKEWWITDLDAGT